MKLKQLQALLEDVEPFAKPKVALEQYVTGARRDSGVQATGVHASCQPERRAAQARTWRR